MNMHRPAMHRQTSCKLSGYRTVTTRFGVEVGASRLSPTSTLRVPAAKPSTSTQPFEYHLPLACNG